MTRVRYTRDPWNYVEHYRDFPWFDSWIERPRLLASAVAVSLATPATVCDPACGDGSVVVAANRLSPIRHAVLGDISPDTVSKILPASLPFPASIFVQDARKTLTDIEPVDLIVMTEFLEHVEQPEEMLELARAKSNWLVASSPIVPEGEADHTTQHYWSFDMEGYREMLLGSGWKPMVWQTANCVEHPYAAGFQVWGCLRA